jgi:tetratricopeptide (TPR) repeat protein
MKTHTKTKGYIDLGRKKLKKNRRNRSAIKELAIQCAHMGQHEEALRLWKEFVKLQPKSAEAYLNIGAACWNLSRYAEAVLFAQKALYLDPMLKEAYFNKGIGLLMLGRAGEAKQILQEILEQQPDYPAAQFMLCVTCTSLGELGQVGDKIAKMQATPIGPYLSESFLEVAKRLFAASQIEYARRIIEIAVNYNCANDEMVALLTQCRDAA